MVTEAKKQRAPDALKRTESEALKSSEKQIQNQRRRQAIPAVGLTPRVRVPAVGLPPHVVEIRRSRFKKETVSI